MAATVKIIRHTGTSTASGGTTQTAIDGTTDRAATQEAVNPGTSNPIPVPTTSGTNYSFWVVTRLSATVAPTTAINNIKWYTDGSNTMGTGVSLNVATATAYISATGTTGTTGNQLTSANYTSALSPSIATDAFAKTSAAPISVAGSIGSVTGNFGDYVVYQVAVISTAGPGVTTAETITWQYNQT